MYVNDSYFEEVSFSYVLRCIEGQDESLVMTVSCKSDICEDKCAIQK